MIKNMIKNFETYINEDYFSKLANRKDNGEMRKDMKVSELPLLYNKQKEYITELDYMFEEFVERLFNKLKTMYGYDSEPMLFGDNWERFDINDNGLPAMINNTFVGFFSNIASSYEVTMKLSFPKSQKKAIKWFTDNIVKVFNEKKELIVVDNNNDRYLHELYTDLSRGWYDNTDDDILDELRNLNKDRVSFLFKFDEPFYFNSEFCKEMEDDDAYDSVEDEYEDVKSAVEDVEAYYTAMNKCIENVL